VLRAYRCVSLQAIPSIYRSCPSQILPSLPWLIHTHDLIDVSKATKAH
jgi:hypothetical protein